MNSNNKIIEILYQEHKLYHSSQILESWKNFESQKSIPSMKKDFGKFLYRHVHSLHHKSYNPTAFSGTSMHPVEAFLYYTAAAIPCLWGGHPILAVTAIIDLGIAAWLSLVF